MDSCENCRFWRRGNRSGNGTWVTLGYGAEEITTGYCHREPRESYHKFPDSFCGEHKSREAKPAEGVNGELLAAARALLLEVDEMTRRVGWTGYGARQAVFNAIVRAEKASR